MNRLTRKNDSYTDRGRTSGAPLLLTNASFKLMLEAEEEKSMLATNRSLVSVPNKAYRVFVVYTTSEQTQSPNHVHQLRLIEEQIRWSKFEAHFADRRFTFWSPAAIVKDPKLKESWNASWLLLNKGIYAGIWFYGDTTSEYTRQVAMLACRNRMFLNNYADEGSLLDRYLKWVKPWCIPA